MTIWKDNCSSWIKYLKKNLVALAHMLTKFLPEFVQNFTEQFFKGILSSYEDALAQSKAAESTTDLSDVPQSTVADID